MKGVSSSLNSISCVLSFQLKGRHYYLFLGGDLELFICLAAVKCKKKIFHTFSPKGMVTPFRSVIS